MDASELDAALRSVGLAVTGAPRHGASASVFPGEMSDGRAVAIKVFNHGVELERFEREAAILASIEHRSIARLLTYGKLTSGAPYLVTAWVEGETLAQRLAESGPLGTATVRRLLVELGDALDHLHRSGVVHRDLSLANVMISANDSITLIDFGIARAEDHATMTATSDLVGTTRYLAPELLNGDPPTAASDQYACAVMAYELAAGEWPFPAVSSVGETFHHHLSSHPVPLSERLPSAPQALDTALQQALSKDPRDRFESMRIMADAALDGPGQTPRAIADKPSGRSRGIVAGLVAFGALALVAAVLAGTDWFNGTDEANGSITTTAPTTASTTSTSNEGQRAASRGEPEPSAAPAAWPAGLAAALECNLLGAPGFETNSLPDNFWYDPEDVDRERLVPDSGVDGSAAVAIGRDGEFGAFGQIVDVRPNAEYVFAATVSFSETPFVAQIAVQWLNADFELLPDEEVFADLLTAAPGRAVLDVPPPPDQATFAVTRLYKDDSGGVLFADELVFAESDTACEQIVRDGG